MRIKDNIYLDHTSYDLGNYRAYGKFFNAGVYFIKTPSGLRKSLVNISVEMSHGHLHEIIIEVSFRLTLPQRAKLIKMAYDSDSIKSLESALSVKEKAEFRKAIDSATKSRSNSIFMRFDK